MRISLPVERPPGMDLLQFARVAFVPTHQSIRFGAHTRRQFKKHVLLHQCKEDPRAETDPPVVPEA
jgi:hypothetical protein